MARIAPIEARHQTPLVRLLNWGARRTMGQELAPLNVLVHNPGFVLPYLATSRFVRGRTQLVATLNGCAWYIDFGCSAGQKEGVAADKLLAVPAYATDPRFSPAERAALAYAAAVTEVGARVPDELFADLRRHLSQREIVELTMAIAVENMYNRINAPLEIEAQDVCAVPKSRTASAA